MKKVAIFDRFYKNLGHGGLDVVSLALDPEAHEVIAHANTIGAAALTLAAMHKREIETPNVVVIGGRLEDDRRYLKHPATFTTSVIEMGRTWYGRPTPKQRQVTTTLLPVSGPGGTTVLPTSYKSRVNPKEVAQFADELDAASMGTGRAAYVLSHLTRILLPEDVRLIGISSINTMAYLPVDGVIERGNPASPGLLREAING